MVQVPAVTKLSAPTLVIVQTPVVDDVNVGVSPESDVAVSVGVVPKFCAPGLLKVMVCVAAGVMLLDAIDAGPVPATLSAVTVKVYACPLVRPVMTIGDAAPCTGATSAGLTVTVYAVIAEPPMFSGDTNATLAWVSPAMAVPMVGAPGTTALTVNDRLTCDAGRKLVSPAWSALRVQVPAARNVNVPPDVVVQTPGVDEVNVTARPEVALALTVGDVPKFCAPGLANVMICGAAGVMLFDAADAAPVPAAFVAVTVKV